jgi:hypothetical protein
MAKSRCRLPLRKSAQRTEEKVYEPGILSQPAKLFKKPGYSM